MLTKTNSKQKTPKINHDTRRKKGENWKEISTIDVQSNSVQFDFVLPAIYNQSAFFFGHFFDLIRFARLFGAGPL